MAGPLTGLKVVEMAGIGPAPFAAMLLADLGADVLRIAPPGTATERHDVTARSRSTIGLDLRAEGATEAVLQAIVNADLLIEGFRPGVMERLGLGPEVCLQRNPKLVYGRMTGWGQTGPLSHAAGHDINYIAITGALHAIGRAGEPPVPPLNYIGDFGGGSMLLILGLMCALHESRSSGCGQVVDAAMTDGAALLSAMVYGMKAAGQWNNRRGDNLLDGAAPYYDTYACADGKYVAVGALETRFYAELRRRAGLDDSLFDDQADRARWAGQKQRLAEILRTRSREEWCKLLEGTDACFAPVLDWDEAARHPHNRSRTTHLTLDGVLQPAPAPRFSRTPAALPTPPRTEAADVALARWGVDPALAARFAGGSS